MGWLESASAGIGQADGRRFVLGCRGKRVHLTVQDEPLGMVIRSRSYWALYPLVGPISKKFC